MKNKTETLKPDCTYHIFNRAIGNERLFVEEGNYLYFLEKFKHYVNPIADSFCYCLMPNHFHFLLRIKGRSELHSLGGPKDLQGFQNFEGLLSRQFSHFFNAYSKALNNQQLRKGSLFLRPFKRKKVSEEQYFQKLVHYIHYNPVAAEICKRPEEYRWSSYKAIISSAQTNLKRDEVLARFGGLENFVFCHQHPPRETGID